MKRPGPGLNLIVAILGIFCVTAGMLLFQYLNIPAARQNNQDAFKSAWSSQLGSYSRLDEIQGLQQSERKGHLDWRGFPDGSWVAVAWHCAHDESAPESEWDGVVLRDSLGDLYWADYHFCGGEGFQVEFQEIEAKSLPQFYKALRFHKTPLSKEG